MDIVKIGKRKDFFQERFMSTASKGGGMDLARVGIDDGKSHYDAATIAWEGRTREDNHD